MQNPLRKYLLARKAEIQALVEPLRQEIQQKKSELQSYESELSDVEKSLAAIGMVNGVQTDVDFASRSFARHGKIREGTIKDFIVQVLSSEPKGLVALDILSAINKRFNKNYDRTSLSPQLSRLRHEGLLDRRGIVWHMKHAPLEEED